MKKNTLIIAVLIISLIIIGLSIQEFKEKEDGAMYNKSESKQNLTQSGEENLSPTDIDYKLNISKEELELISCHKDSDCVLVEKGCCGNANCNFKAINKNYKGKWENDSRNSCQGALCIQIMCMQTLYAKCINDTCAIVHDECFDKWRYLHNSVIMLKFKENISKEEINNILAPLDDFEPKLNYRINFSFDLYKFKVPHQNVSYSNLDYIWNYVKDIYSFNVYLDGHEGINSFVTGYGEVSLIANNSLLNESEVVDIINSFNSNISAYNLNVEKGFYGFYYNSYDSDKFARYICDNLEYNEKIEKLSSQDIWTLPIYETIGGCTKLPSYYPIHPERICK